MLRSWVLILASIWALTAPLNGGAPACDPVEKVSPAQATPPARSKGAFFRTLKKANPLRALQRADAAVTEWSIRFSSWGWRPKDDQAQIEQASGKALQSSITSHSECPAAP